MSKLHSSIVDADGIHEPKGHSTAINHSEMSVNGGFSYWKQRAKEAVAIGSNGQTIFVLASAPIDDKYRQIILNGIDVTDDFTFTGNAMTYIGTDFILETTDAMTARYHF